MPRNTKPLPQDPTAELVREYHEAFLANERFSTAEATLDQVFGQWRNNDCFRNILIKACLLNSLYSTNINAIYAAAQRIRELEVDRRLEAADHSLVNEIAKVQVNEDTERDFYSFASKYCHFHNNPSYPIYDSYVEDVLVHYQIKCPFMELMDPRKKTTKKHIREHLKDYEAFCVALNALRARFALESASVRELDHFLWGYGRELYPKKYKKKNPRD
ncbi:MAG: hypothetical protein ABIP48_13165 [Planctomycetota bacterium]